MCESSTELIQHEPAQLRRMLCKHWLRVRTCILRQGRTDNLYLDLSLVVKESEERVIIIQRSAYAREGTQHTHTSAQEPNRTCILNCSVNASLISVHPEWHRVASVSLKVYYSTDATSQSVSISIRQSEHVISDHLDLPRDICRFMHNRV